MSNLRQLTSENHRRTERTKFAHRLLKRQITPEQYYIYMSNQLMAYYVLENAADQHGLFDGIESVKRARNISTDVRELESEHSFENAPIVASTKRYMDYIQSISIDPDRVMAHIYVRHMGDLSGGQIIKRFIPGSGMHYCFEGDVDELKNKIREKLHDGMADEANRCFDMIHEIFEELESVFASMGPADNTTI